MASHALLSIVMLCKNIETLSFDALPGPLEYKWALAIAKLSNLRFLWTDFDSGASWETNAEAATRVGTGILSLSGCSKARHIILQGLASVTDTERSSSLLIPRRDLGPVPKYDFDLTPFHPPETRSIEFVYGYWRSPENMETIFDRLTQGGKVLLKSVNFGSLCSEPEVDPGEVNLVVLLERFGSGLKKLKVDRSWYIGGGYPRLGSVCPGLEELDVDSKELKNWNPDDAFPESLKKVVVRYPGRRHYEDSHIELLIHPSRVNGELKRVFEVFKVSRHVIASHMLELRDYLTEGGFLIRDSQKPQSDD